MGATGGNTNQAVSSINVTPLIDVLLTLLIIFMVIVPVAPRGLQSQLPQPAKDPARSPDAAIVVQVLADGRSEPLYRINGEPFAREALRAKLSEIFAARQSRVLFVQGEPSLPYGKIADVIDIGHLASLDTIALLTPRVTARE